MHISLRPVPGVSTPQAVAPGAAWLPGRLLMAKVVSEGGEARLLIAGQEYQVAWSGEAKPAPGSDIALRVIGMSQGKWLLELVKDSAAAPLISVLEVLERAGLPVTYRNLLSMHRRVSPEKLASPANNRQDDVLCPWDKGLLRQAIGYEAVLTPAMLTVEPFPLGLFAVRGEQEEAKSPDKQQAWLLALQLDTLGQVEVLGQGEWPRQAVTFIAREETVSLLKKKEAETKQLLSTAGIVLRQLAYRPAAKPIVQLIESDLLTVSGFDISL